MPVAVADHVPRTFRPVAAVPRIDVVPLGDEVYQGGEKLRGRQRPARHPTLLYVGEEGVLSVGVHDVEAAPAASRGFDVESDEAGLEHIAPVPAVNRARLALEIADHAETCGRGPFVRRDDPASGRSEHAKQLRIDHSAIRHTADIVVGEVPHGPRGQQRSGPG